MGKNVEMGYSYGWNSAPFGRPFQNWDKWLAGRGLSRCLYALVETLLNQAVSLPLKWNGLYAERQPDVTSQHLKTAAELLTLRRDKIQIIDAENNRFKEGEPEKQELGEEQEKPKPKGRKGKEPQKQPSSDEPENPSPK